MAWSAPPLGMRSSPRPSRSPAAYAWWAVVVVVVGYDGWALARNKETLTGYFHRMAMDEPGIKGKLARVSIDAGWIGLSWHLLGRGKHLLPDPYHTYYMRAHPLWRLHDVAAALNRRSSEISSANSQAIIADPIDIF